MATSEYKEPVEDDDNQSSGETTDEGDQFMKSGPHEASPQDVESLKSQISALKETASAHEEETLGIKARLVVLEQEVQIATEGVKTTEQREREARALAVGMAQERTEIRTELDRALLESSTMQMCFREILTIAMENALTSRAVLTADYEEKIVQLRENIDEMSNKLNKWEEEVIRLQEENAKLKAENDYFGATIFTVVKSSHAGETQPVPAGQQARLNCYSCGQCYLPGTDSATGCHFHPLRAVPRSIWRRWSSGPGPGEVDGALYSRHVYWPCCNTLSVNRPPGCCMGLHHQSWEMDLRTKKIMLSPTFLETVDLQNTPLIIM